MENTLKLLRTATSATRATTLITYIIPGSAEISLVSKHITNEMATAYNIKSKVVRNSVIGSLKSLLANIQFYGAKGKVPPNGLVMLSGEINETVPSYL